MARACLSPDPAGPSRCVATAGPRARLAATRGRLDAARRDVGAV